MGNVRKMTDDDLDNVGCMVMRAIASAKGYSYAQKYALVEEIYAPKEIKNRFFNPGAIALVIEYEDKIVGSAVLHPKNDEDVSLAAMYVEPSVTNMGFGTKIAREALKIAQDQNFKRVNAWAMMGALSFYQKLGFRTVGIPFCADAGELQYQAIQFEL
jgi:GNAT superfamily N-acetyltransferase